MPTIIRNFVGGQFSAADERGRAIAVAVGGGVADAAHGFWVGVTRFDPVAPAMTIYRVEIFCTAVGISRMKTHRQAVDLINANEFGNGTAIFTRDGDTAGNSGHAIQVDRHGLEGVREKIAVCCHDMAEPFYVFMNRENLDHAKTPKVKLGAVIGHDTLPFALERLRAGSLAATVNEHARDQRRGALRQMAEHLRRGTPLRAMSLKPTLVTRESLLAAEAR